MVRVSQADYITRADEVIPLFMLFGHSGSPLRCFYLFAATRAYALVAVCGLLIAVASPLPELRQ